MKKSFLLIAITLLGSSVFAGAINSINKARYAQDRLGYLMDYPGVNGLGIGGCDPKTGVESRNYDRYVYCVVVNTETKAAAKKILQTFPVGTKVNGIYVAVRVIGVITIQPRISIGR